jgi:hypothetical protein
MLQAGMSRVQVPMRWNVFNLPNPSSRTIGLGSTHPLTEIEYQESTWGGGAVKDGRRLRLTNLPSSMNGLSRENVGASTSHNPRGLYGLLQG